MAKIIQSRFEQLTKSVRKTFSRFAQRFQYDLWKEITENDIAKSRNPVKAAGVWFIENYKSNPDARVRGRFMQQGQLYIFDYDDPKFKKELDFYDSQPLVLSLGPVKTGEGIREIGLNLHLLPPNVRRIVLYQIYYMFKIRYNSNLYRNKQKTVPVKWQSIYKALEKFGVGFCIRMYIPERKKNTLEFKQEDWGKAIWVPSKGYRKIGPTKLQAEWKKYVRSQKRKMNSSASQNHTSAV